MKFVCSVCKNIIISDNNYCQNCGTKYNEKTCIICNNKFWTHIEERTICSSCYYKNEYHKKYR